MFRPARNPTNVRRCPKPEWIADDDLSATQKAGVRFERRQQDAFVERFGDAFEPAPWFMFQDGERTFHCSPDGILWADRSPIIIEFKLSHTDFAWRQLKHLYLPVVKAAYPDKYFRLLEVCKVFDPSVQVPTDVEIIANPYRCPGRGLGVHVVLGD